VELIQALINTLVVSAVGVILARMTQNLRHEVKTEVRDLRVELKGDIGALRGEMSELRTELKGDIGALRGEMSELRAEIREVRSDLTRVALAVHAEPRTSPQ